MKVLYLNADGPHPHCYGADFLLNGFFRVVGHKNVFDFPEKPSMHLPTPWKRDACQIDSDDAFPYKRHTLAEALEGVDLVMIAVQPNNEHTAQMIHGVCEVVPRSVPIAAYDPSDVVNLTRDWYEQAVGRELAAFFKREVPLTWGPEATQTYIPLPLCYPAARIPDPMPKKHVRVFYHATTHNGGTPGVPRMRIAHRLRELVPEEQLNLRLYPSQEHRPKPEDYHTMMAYSSVGVSWNGAVNWDCNRFWESLAYGLCLVAQRPTIQIPAPFVSGEHLWYCDSPEQVAEVAAEMIREPERASDIALMGHRHFVHYHTAEARVRYVFKHLGWQGEVV